MKKLIVASVLMLGLFTANAQTKIGYINTDELIGVMPEAAVADKQLEEYKNSLGLQGQELQKDADEKAEQFVKDSLKLSPSMKEIKREEVIKAYREAGAWQQGGAEAKYNQKTQELLQPIRLKAMDAIKLVAKNAGYTYVLDVSSIIVAPPGDDIIGLVKKQLGIKDPAPAKPATATK